MKYFVRFGWVGFFFMGFSAGMLGCSGGGEPETQNQNTGQNDDDGDHSENGGSGGNASQNQAGAGGGVSLLLDADGDGFPENQGDCDDSTGDIKPGAEDIAGDSIDQDCGGTFGPDPYVSTTCAVPDDGHCFATIQGAINAVVSKPTEPADDDYPHQIVWVFPGTYEEYEVSPNGKAFHLKSTHGASQTIVDAKQQGSVMVINDGETLDTIIDGFTLTNGSASYGGGMILNYSSPTLMNVTVSSNYANDGGGMYLDNSSPTMKNVTVSDNSARSSGGGMFLDANSPTLTNVTILGNSATYGGGMFLYYSSPTMKNVTVSDNSASSSGGGMFLDNPSYPTLTNVMITGNTAFYNGGGVFLISSCPTINNSVIAYNKGTNNVYLFDDYCKPTFLYSSLYTTDGSNFGGATLDSSYYSTSYTTVEPGFLAYDNHGIPTDFHLAKDSKLINLGSDQPSDNDPDKSRNDMGIYGGPEANAWDLDGDGCPDFYWPGGYDSSPGGVDKTKFDKDDSDASVGCK